MATRAQNKSENIPIFKDGERSNDKRTSEVRNMRLTSMATYAYKYMKWQTETRT